jgi:hypothetical protein
VHWRDNQIMIKDNRLQCQPALKVMRKGHPDEDTPPPLAILAGVLGCQLPLRCLKIGIWDFKRFAITLRARCKGN